MSLEGEKKPPPTKVYTREDYPQAFDPSAYLKDFYSKTDDEPAMHVMLRFLPNVGHRLPQCDRLLDVGSGPTVHVALCFRNIANEIYLSDYVEQNRNAINSWLSDSGQFDWSNVSKYIAMLEGNPDDWKSVENQARQKVKGVLHCDVFRPPVLSENFASSFDIVTTIFCLEYASNNSVEYQTAVRNVVNLIKPGGYFVMGGVLEETWYQFGGQRYSCHYLTENEMLNTIRSNKIDTDDQKTFKYLNHEGIFLLVGRKMV